MRLLLRSRNYRSHRSKPAFLDRRRYVGAFLSRARVMDDPEPGYTEIAAR